MVLVILIVHPHFVRPLFFLLHSFGLGVHFHFSLLHGFVAIISAWPAVASLRHLLCNLLWTMTCVVTLLTARETRYVDIVQTSQGVVLQFHFQLVLVDLVFLAIG